MDFIQQHLIDCPESMKNRSWKEKLEFLFQDQLETWTMARNHYRAFETVERRPISFGGFEIIVQHNPARARSTCADLSKTAIENRKCFLCASNLPAEQKGFVLLEHYLLLVNPFPIFKRHFTLSDFSHTPQVIAGRIGDLLAMAKELKGYTLFYNGPRCGASAPDHFHFQAVPFGEMPIDRELDLIRTAKAVPVYRDEHLQIDRIDHYLRTAVVFESASAERLSAHFEEVIGHMPFDQESGEPMMNLLATCSDEDRFRLVLFPRKAQRPSCYYAEGPDRLMVSPASVELGGVVVVPREDDFLRIIHDDLSMIFSEVSGSDITIES